MSAHISVYGGTNQALVPAGPSSGAIANYGPISLPNYALPRTGPRSLRLRRLIGTTESANLVPTWATTVPSRHPTPA